MAASPGYWIFWLSIMMYLTPSGHSEDKTLEMIAAPYETIVLPCKGLIQSVTEDLHVSWMKMRAKTENNLLVYGFEKGKPTNKHQAYQFQNRTEMVFDWSGSWVNLTLKDVTELDSGVYQCQIYNEYGHWTQNITLSIKDKTWNVTAAPHETAHLPCKFPIKFGTDDLHVSWVKMGEKDKNLQVYGFKKQKPANQQQVSQFKDRTESDLDRSGGWVNLTLKDVTEMDSGIYRCQGYNANGSWTQNILLYIEDPKGRSHIFIIASVVVILILVTAFVC
ncbi:CD226 antigen-like [Pelobates cultripes]|uniref:CD226 antigen-like n=1 Tax=Pelobates cultripes TaxID=61616 RepID=A0AAD1QWI5_PELCU|nr:CD226 antigen-like [Pelobates cultripes]